MSIRSEGEPFLRADCRSENSLCFVVYLSTLSRLALNVVSSWRTDNIYVISIAIPSRKGYGQSGRRCTMVSPTSKDINTFVAACETLLSPAIMPQELSAREAQAIQYYLSALAVKFPAILK